MLALLYLLLGFVPYSAVLVIYFAGVTGSYAWAMGLLSVTMVSATLFEIPTGLYSDIVGRRKTLVLGSLSLLVASLLFAVGHSHLVLVLGAVAAGLSRAFFSGNNAAYLYDILAEEKREDEYSTIIGKIGAAEQAGLGVGAVLGGIVAQFSLPLVMWISVVPNALLLVGALRLAEVRRHSAERVAAYTHIRRSLSQFKANSRLRNLSLASMANWAVSESAWQFQPVFVNSLWPLWAVGLCNTATHLGASVSFFFAGRVLGRFEALRTLLFKTFLNRAMGFTALLYPTMASPAIMASGDLLYGIGIVATGTLLQREFTDEQRATMGSINSLGGSLLFGVVSLFLGLGADLLGPRGSLLVTEALLILPLLVFWRLFRQESSPKTRGILPS